MTDPKTSLPSPHIIQIMVLVIGLAASWVAMDTRSQAVADTVRDHETRMRTLEREVLSGLARIQARLDQIEKVNTP